MKVDVAICVPSGDLVHADFTMALAGMLRSTPGTIKLAYVTGRSSIVAHARNMCVKSALELGAKHILFLDSDITFPNNTLNRLLHWGKDIVGAVYRRRSEPFEVMGVPLVHETRYAEGSLPEMAIIPTGCMLIRREVFEALPKPYFRFETDEANDRIVGEDVLFCNMARQRGFHVYADVSLSMAVGHIGQTTHRIEGEAADERRAA